MKKQKRPLVTEAFMTHWRTPFVIDVLSDGRVRKNGPTLHEWLAFNEATDTFDAELLDILPVEFHSDYEDRLRLNAEYEAKFAASMTTV